MRSAGLRAFPCSLGTRRPVFCAVNLELSTLMIRSGCNLFLLLPIYARWRLAIVLVYELGSGWVDTVSQRHGNQG